MKNIKQKWEVFVGSVNIYVFERYKDSRGYPRERKIAKNVWGEQNAHLIANAPEMLAVLKEYVDGYELYDPSEVEEMRMAVRTKDYRKSANVLFMALEVIAKAEGSAS